MHDAATTRGVGNGPVAGRFVLLHRVPNTIDQSDDVAYITSWDTWEEASAAFPIDDADSFLLDQETGREWLAGSPYEWEAART